MPECRTAGRLFLIYAEAPLGIYTYMRVEFEHVVSATYAQDLIYNG